MQRTQDNLSRRYPNVAVYPETHARIARIAGRRRWTHKVCVDEAIKLLERMEEQPSVSMDVPSVENHVDGDRATNTKPTTADAMAQSNVDRDHDAPTSGNAHSTTA